MITPNTVHSWTCEPSSIDVARILRVHKYRDVSKVRPVIVKAAEVASSRAETLAQPDARYIYLPIESFENQLLKVSGDIEFKSEAFHQYLGGCDYLLAFVMTIGAELDETVIGLVENVFEPLDALFLETVGWLTIERATRQFAQYLKAQFSEQGWEVSLRLGPGY